MKTRGQIETVSDVLSAADELVEETGTNPIWRGHSDSGWSLRPSVFRTDSGVRREQNMIAMFRSRAPSRYPNCPHSDDLAAWLFLMQHYRAPTRLLDWTESPLIGLYFATEEGDSRPAALWAANPFALNSRQVNVPKLLLADHEKAAETIRAAFSGNELADRVVSVLPTEIDIRMLLQQAVFTVHASARPLEEQPDAAHYLWKYEIPGERKKSLREQLLRLGIRGSSLFPDLEHLASEVAGKQWKDFTALPVSEEDSESSVLEGAPPESSQ